MLVRAPLAAAEIVQLLESLRDGPRQVPVWTIVLSRHQSLADRQRLIQAGARHLLSMPVDDATLSRVVRAALMDLATSRAIQDYVASHKSAVGRMLSAVFEIRTMDEAQKLSRVAALRRNWRAGCASRRTPVVWPGSNSDAQPNRSGFG